ncbi:hypothetical protein IWX90DRAFT_284325 [Phyllosticta citrichinensis]|uniref:Uncharacterized protein n=1 Tax=Phyllosticta citrichinensis TaxID=1130410 RepID=A0ABR1XNZ3_9PEZI
MMGLCDERTIASTSKHERNENKGKKEIVVFPSQRPWEPGSHNSAASATEKQIRVRRLARRSSSTTDQKVWPVALLLCWAGQGRAGGQQVTFLGERDTKGHGRDERQGARLGGVIAIVSSRFPPPSASGLFDVCTYILQSKEHPRHHLIASLFVSLPTILCPYLRTGRSADSALKSICRCGGMVEMPPRKSSIYLTITITRGMPLTARRQPLLHLGILSTISHVQSSAPYPISNSCPPFSFPRRRSCCCSMAGSICCFFAEKRKSRARSCFHLLLSPAPWTLKFSVALSSPLRIILFLAGDEAPR